jgi:hypothetical protein
MVGGPNGDGEDTQAITPGQLTADDFAYLWADVAPLHDYPTTPSSDPVRLRAQAWADRFDAIVRTVTGNMNAPRPRIVIVPTRKENNAYSSSAYARLGVPVGDPQHPLEDGELVVLRQERLGTSLQTRQGPIDVPHPAAWNDVGQLIARWNAVPSTQPDCALALANGRVVAPNARCTALPGAPDALLLAQSSEVSITSRAIASLADESELAFIVAHELGHHFRAHGSPLVQHDYGFWYESDSDGKRPVPAAKASQLRAQYEAFFRRPMPLDAVEGSAFEPPVRSFIVAAAAVTDARGGYVNQSGLSSCLGWNAWAAEHPGRQFLVDAFTTATGGIADAYLELERLVIDCAADIVVDGSADDPALDLLTVMTALQPYGEDAVARYPTGATRTLADYLAAVQAQALAVAADAETFRSAMNQQQIGWYTVEQEADEIGLELMLRAGYTREQVLAAWVAVMKVLDAYAPEHATDTGRADAATCEAWMKDDFTTVGADGRRVPIIMTLGDLFETHHGNCYRLYNLWRESKAHDYASGPQLPPLTPAWSTIRSLAQTLSATATAP